MIVGYARVSTTDQDLSIQIDRLNDMNCDKVFSEKLSGSNMKRPELLKCLDFLRDGDCLLVTRLDRFARSMSDLHSMLDKLDKKGVGFRCLDQDGVDTTSPHGKLLLGILGSVAEFETALRAERQREGIQRAKANGVYKGGKARIDQQRLNNLLQQGYSHSEVAKMMNISRQSVYRLAGDPSSQSD